MDLKTILDGTGYPVAYSHFVDSANIPLPSPPFIVFINTRSSNFKADNKVHYNIENVQVELYTDKKDLIAEGKIQTALNDAEIPYETTETYIESEQLFQKIYEMRLI
jgi:hypothetical protein